MTSELLHDALAISDAWSNALDLHAMIETQVRSLDVPDAGVDIVALGKAAREMALAARDVLGDHVLRQLVIVDEGPAFSLDADVEFVIGEHPLPGLGSLMAGERLVDFLDQSSAAQCTIFLISGGASSLCALPTSPVVLDDLHELFAAVLEYGADITDPQQTARRVFEHRRWCSLASCPDATFVLARHGRQRRVGGALGGVGPDLRLRRPFVDEVRQLLSDVGQRDDATGDAILDASERTGRDAWGSR